jgi:hypothetical protein
MGGTCVLVSPARLRLGICNAFASLLATIIEGFERGCKGCLAVNAMEVDETKWWLRMSFE